MNRKLTVSYNRDEILADIDDAKTQLKVAMKFKFRHRRDKELTCIHDYLESKSFRLPTDPPIVCMPYELRTPKHMREWFDNMVWDAVRSLLITLDEISKKTNLKSKNVDLSRLIRAIRSVFAHSTKDLTWCFLNNNKNTISANVGGRSIVLDPDVLHMQPFDEYEQYLGDDAIWVLLADELKKFV